LLADTLYLSPNMHMQLKKVLCVIILNFGGYNVITKLFCGICRNTGTTKVICMTEHVNIIKQRYKFIYILMLNFALVIFFAEYKFIDNFL